jgi:hypothetical protein
MNERDMCKMFLVSSVERRCESFKCDVLSTIVARLAMQRNACRLATGVVVRNLKRDYFVHTLCLITQKKKRYLHGR